MCSGPNEEVEDRRLRVIIAGGLTGQDAGLHRGSQSLEPMPFTTAPRFTAPTYLLKNYTGVGQVSEFGGAERVWLQVSMLERLPLEFIVLNILSTSFFFLIPFWWLVESLSLSFLCSDA